MTPHEADPKLTFALALLAGMFAQTLARHIRLPGIVVLLITGVALGPDGLGWIQPRDLGTGLFVIVDFAVAIILFEGGLNLEMSRLRRAGIAIRRLITLGAVVTLLGGAVAAHLWLGWGLMESFLFGGLVVVTGPTVVGPLVSMLRLKPRVSTVLEAEGVLIDPIGAILAVVILRIALSGESGWELLSHSGVGPLRFGAGLVLGAVGGFLISRVLRMSRLLPEGLENVSVLASVLLIYAGSEALLSHSGVLAVTIAGIVVGNARIPVEGDLREFKDQLTVMLIGLLFVILAADVRYEQVVALGWGGLAVVATLIFVVRPLSVWLCTIGSELETAERLFIAWVAPRGIVAAAIASLVATELERAGLSGGPELRALVFLTIAATVTLAGLTAGPIANWLGVRMPKRDSVAILSAQSLGLELAEELRRGGVPVVLIDSNPSSVRRAEEMGFTVVYGDALHESVMQRAQLGFVRTVVALTANKTLNGVFVARARDRFDVPNGLVATSDSSQGLVAEQLERGHSKIVFDGPHDVERWDVRGRRGDVRIEHFVYTANEASSKTEPTSAGRSNECLVMLTVERNRAVFVMDGEWTFRTNDRIAVAIHTPEYADAVRELVARGFSPVSEADVGDRADTDEASETASSSSSSVGLGDVGNIGDVRDIGDADIAGGNA